MRVLALLGLLLLVGCSSPSESAGRPAAVPTAPAGATVAEVEAAQPLEDPPTPDPVQPTPARTSGVVSSAGSPFFDLTVLSAERGEGLTLEVGLYNNSDDRTLSFDAQALLEGATLSDGRDTRRPERVTVAAGNAAPLPPRSGVVGTLRFAPLAGEVLDFRASDFATVSISPSTGEDDPAPPLPEGSWQLDVPPFPSSSFPSAGLAVRSIRVRGEELILDLAIVNLSDGTLTGGESTVRGADARLISSRGLAYAPSNVTGAIAQGILPSGRWLPGEAHAGLLHFPRPESGPLRLSLPSFPDLSLDPNAAEPLALATAASYPPHDGPPPDLPLPQAATTASADYAAVRDVLARVGEAFARGDDQDAFLEHFAGSARGKMETWWPGIVATPLTEATFELDRTGQSTASEVRGARFLLFYRLEGDSPQNRFMLPVELDLQKQEDRWRVTRWESDTPLWSQVWQVSASEHFLVLADVSIDGARLAALREAAEAAYREVTATLPTLAALERYALVIAATPEQFEALAQQGDLVQGVATSRVLQQGDERETNSLSILVSGATLAEGEAQRTIAHELLHLLLAPDTRTVTPPWVVEGSATFFSEGVPWETLRQWGAGDGQSWGSLEELTARDTLIEPTLGGTSEQYAYAAATIGYLVERFGQPAVLDFYRAFAAAPSASLETEATAQQRVALTRELLAEHFNLTLEQLEAESEGWIAQNL